MTKTELLQTFSIQISLTLIIVMLIFSPLLSGLILKLWKLISRGKFEEKEHPIYGTLKGTLVFISFKIAFGILPLSNRIMEIWDLISRVVTIIIITKLLTIIVRKDSKIMQKTIATSKNETVNTFVCKILRGIIWICSGFIIIRELGYNLTGLMAGLGVRQCYYISCRSRYS